MCKKLAFLCLVPQNLFLLAILSIRYICVFAISLVKYLFINAVKNIYNSKRLTRVSYLLVGSVALVPFCRQCARSLSLFLSLTRAQAAAALNHTYTYTQTRTHVCFLQHTHTHVYNRTHTHSYLALFAYIFFFCFQWLCKKKQQQSGKIPEKINGKTKK